ncbi:MAG TPA: hypothetical protein VK582_16175 [Pyrinomonadaceae bacterium]|nr:hypothetical protein [Pyrinomonadaceae bacterium]
MCCGRAARPLPVTGANLFDRAIDTRRPAAIASRLDIAPGTSIVDNAMKSSRSQSRKRRKSIIDSIRRPIAPPGHPLTHAKPDEKARPAGRKAKHKPGRNADLESRSEDTEK